MSLTRANIENDVLFGRGLGFWFADVGVDGTTVNGTNATMTALIRDSMNGAGYLTVDPINVTDADVATIAADDIRQVLELTYFRGIQLTRSLWGRAEERILISPTGSYASLDEKTRILILHNKARRLQTEIEECRRRLDTLYNDSTPSIDGGSIALGFVEQPIPGIDFPSQ